MSEEIQKDAFTVSKDGKDYIVLWDEVAKGDNKGSKFPTLDMEAHSLEDIIAFFGDAQTKLILAARARQTFKAWYNGVIDQHDAFTDAARADFIKLVQEGKLARITMSELNDQIQNKYNEAKKLAQQVADPNTEPTLKGELSIKLAETFNEVDRLEAQKDSLKRSRKKKSDDEDDE